MAIDRQYFLERTMAIPDNVDATRGDVIYTVAITINLLIRVNVPFGGLRLGELRRKWGIYILAGRYFGPGNVDADASLKTNNAPPVQSLTAEN